MTQWRTPSVGRERGLRGLFLAWVQVLTSPVAFFRHSISPGDQGPAVGFAVAVSGAASAEFVVLETVKLPGGETATGWMAVLVVGAIAVLLAPTALHLLAAVQTVLLAVAVPQRGGVSETVQVLAYASAPCAVAGVPISGLRAMGAVYASVLLIVGLATVHQISVPRATAVAAIPASLAFGYGFGGLRATRTFIAQIGGTIT